MDGWLSPVSIIMIATIAVIAAIAERKKFSDHMETTLQRSQRSLESG